MKQLAFSFLDQTKDCGCHNEKNQNCICQDCTCNKDTQFEITEEPCFSKCVEIIENETQLFQIDDKKTQ